MEIKTAEIVEKRENINRNDDEGKIGYKLLCVIYKRWFSMGWNDDVEWEEKSAHHKNPEPDDGKKCHP